METYRCVGEKLEGQGERLKEELEKERKLSVRGEEGEDVEEGPVKEEQGGTRDTLFRASLASG